MTKSEIIEHLVLNGPYDKKTVQTIVDSFLNTVKDSVLQNEDVLIRGFGTFYKLEKKARKVHSPIAKKVIEVPAKETIGFKASKVAEFEKTTGA